MIFVALDFVLILVLALCSTLLKAKNQKETMEITQTWIHGHPKSYSPGSSLHYPIKRRRQRNRLETIMICDLIHNQLLIGCYK